MNLCFDDSFLSERKYLFLAHTPSCYESLSPHHVFKGTLPGLAKKFALFIYLFIYFLTINNVNYNLNKILLTKLSYFLLTILLKNYRKNQSF